MLSTIDLLEYGMLGPEFNDSRGLLAIQKQIQLLVHKLSPGYLSPQTWTECFSLESPSRMWFPRVDFRTSRGIREYLWGETTISPARAGTNILEYARLTELSRDLIYFKNVTPLPHSFCSFKLR